MARIYAKVRSGRKGYEAPGRGRPSLAEPWRSPWTVAVALTAALAERGVII